MKKIDIVLIFVASLIIIGWLSKFTTSISLFKIVLGVIVCIVTLYWKLIPYKGQLLGKYAKAFSIIDKIVSPVVALFAKVPKLKVGQNLSIDSGMLILYVVLIVLLIII